MRLPQIYRYGYDPEDDAERQENHGGIQMPEKLVQGDRFPEIRLDLTDGSTITLPDQTPGRYLALLFYRGEW